MNLKFAPFARTLLMTGTFAVLALAATASYSQDEPSGPPPGMGRIAIVQGNVSIQPVGEDSWGQAEPNMPLSPGYRVFADQQSRGEVQAGVVRAYFGPNTDLTLNGFDSEGVVLGVASGSAEVASDGFPFGGSVQVQTPNGAIGSVGRVLFRVDVFPDQQSSVVTNNDRSSQLLINGGGGFQMRLEPGQSVQLSGTNPVYAQPLEPAPMDDFLRWSVDLEVHRVNSPSAQYVSAEVGGYDELDRNGEWQGQSQYGPIWFPHVDAGWAPYRYGHWVSRPFYGWTWVADEPWGAAPFHYGRWAQVGGRWGWIPGARDVRAVWCPAQVVFAGGISAGGAGVSVWFPLGPGEPYRPWYPASPEYINRVNITNIHESNVVHIQNNYTTIINNTTNITYVNRTVAVTAMKQEDFAAGRPTKAVAVKVDPQQLAHIQPARPEAKPPAQPVILHPVAKPAAAPAARPVLINNKGELAAAVPHAKPMPAPVKPVEAPKPIPGRAPAGAPSVGGKPVAAPPPPAKPAVEPAKPMAAPMPPAKPAVEPAKPMAAPTPAKPPAPAATKPAPPETLKPQPKAVTPPPAPRPVPPAPKVEPREVPPPPAAKPVPPAKPAPKDNKKPEDKKKPKEDEPK